MNHRLPDLPFAPSGLQPHMSKKTLELHHGKHHAAYVAKLNKLIKSTQFAEMPLEDIVRQATGELFDNAAQHWNHSFFWLGLTPSPGTRPETGLRAAINTRFKSFAKFKEQFAETAVGTFGSGWAWLVCDRKGVLDIVSTQNAGTPLRDNKVPLLACDVWEHAYYVDYENRRPEYLAAFWSIVDWNRVTERFAAAEQRITS